MDIDELPCYYTSDEIRMAMRFYTLGCVIHERSLMLLEASNADDRWLADVCRHEFHSQDQRVKAESVRAGLDLKTIHSRPP